ncbi:MAG: DUF2934 domain-containing protein [Methylotenera sp.]
MQVSEVTQLNAKNPIPVYGVETKVKKETTPKAESKPSSKTESTENQDVCCQVALCAYYKAEARGFEPGHEMEDWLAAEAEVNR